MLSREEQLQHEIKHKELEARDAIETMIEIGAYDVMPEIAIHLDMDKSEREFYIANLDKATTARYIQPMLDILEDEDEIEHFIEKTLDNGHDKPLVGMITVGDLLNETMWFPIIKLMAGRSSGYVFLMGMFLEKMGDLTEKQFMYFYTNTSSKDFANLISDKGFHLSDNVMKMVFEVAKDLMGNDPMSETNPPAAGLLLNTIDINMDIKKYSFKDEFYNYMYEYTGRDEYLSDAAKDIFIF